MLKKRFDPGTPLLNTFFYVIKKQDYKLNDWNIYFGNEINPRSDNFFFDYS